MRAEWHELDRRIAAFDDEFAALARSDADARRLATIPGIGVMNATALLAAIGNGQTFARGRDLAAWLGLVPRQVTTGGKPRLVGITKRGNKYLRKLLIHGAGCSAIARDKCHASRRLAAWADAARAQECRRGCAGEQAGTDRVGRAAPRRRVRCRARHGGGVNEIGQVALGAAQSLMSAGGGSEMA
jgi:transposase